MPVIRIFEPIRGQDGQDTGTSSDPYLYGVGSDGGITVSRKSSFVAKASISGGAASDIKWYPYSRDWESTDLYYSEDGDGVEGDVKQVNVLVMNPPESYGGDFIYDEIYADYAYYDGSIPYPCVHADWWEKIVVNVVSGKAAVKALYMEGEDCDCGCEKKINAKRLKAGPTETGLTCADTEDLQTCLGPICLGVVHIEGDFQDVEDGNRAGRGSHAKWTRHINKHSDGKRVLVVQQDGSKAVFIKRNDTGKWEIKGKYNAALAQSGSEFIEQVPGGGDWRTQYTYDVYGNLRQVLNRNNKVLYYNYDYSAADSGWRGRLQSISGDLKVIPYFFYDGNGRYASTKLEGSETGWASYFSYDVNNRMSQVKGPTGCVHQFGWDHTNGRVTNVTDPEGYTTYLEFNDAYGAVSKIVEPLDRSSYYQWDTATRVRRETDLLGRVSYYRYAGAGVDLDVDALGNATQRGFDAYGNVIASVDQRGNSSYYVYEAYNLLRTKDALGHESYYRYDANNYRIASIDALFHGTYYAYDVYGNQTAVQDALGGVSYFIYDSNGFRVAAIDPLNHGTYFGYDSWGRQTVQMDALRNASYYSYDILGNQGRVVDARGNATYFEYDLNGRQTRVKNALLYSRQSGYDGRGLRTVEIDELGNAAYFGFNGLQQLTRSTDFANNATLFGYDLVGNRTRVEDPTGSTTYYHCDELNRQKCVEDALAAKIYFEYDAVGNQSRTKDPLGRSTLAYFDALNRQVKTVYADGSESTTEEFDAVGNVLHALDQLGRSSRSSYDELNRVTAQSSAELGWGYQAYGETVYGGHDPLLFSYFRYDKASNRTAVIDGRFHGSYFAYDELNRVAVQWTQTAAGAYFLVDEAASYFGYDEVGNRVRAKDPNGNATYFHFDKLNRMDWQKDQAGYYTYYEYTARNEQSKVKNPRGAETQSIFDAAGRLTTSIDPLNISTYFQYDAAGRRTLTHLAALDQVTYLVYDKVGRQTHVKTMPDGSTIYDTETVYDAAGQTVRAVNPRGYAVYFEYDLVGRQQKVRNALLNETYFGYDVVGNRTFAVSPRGYGSYFGYDAANRLAVSQDAENVLGYFGYDRNGNRTAVVVGTGSEARSTYFAFDSLNRLVAVRAPDSGVTVFCYDKNGNRTIETDPLSRSTYYGYNERNELVRVQDALVKTAYYEYSSTGSLSKSTSPENRVGQFEYDLAERRTRAYYSDGYAAYFGYDAAGNMLTAQEATVGTVYFAFDRMNRATAQKFAVGGAAYYFYDANSNRTRIAYPSGGAAYYTFDELDRMSSIKSPAGYTTSYTFDKSGNRTKSVWGNGAWTYYTFDSAERISSIRHFDDGGLGIAYFDYGRDGRGNITEIARLDGVTTYYGYDLADRLSSEVWKSAAGASIYAFEWDYDLAGNRLSGTEQGQNIAWAYNAAGAIISRVDDSGSTYYIYDLDGNLEVLMAPGGAVTYFEHGAHGLVTKIKPLGGTEISFGYDALLRRTKMVQGAVTTSFKHDGLDLLEVSDASGNLTKLAHGYKTVDGIGSVVEIEKNGARYYLHQDHRGTTYKITDSAGDPVWTGLCDSWGNSISETGSNPSLFWYQGQAWWKVTVGSTRLYVSPTRLYAVELGVFVDKERGSNYRYCFNNPVRWADPDGHGEDQTDNKSKEPDLDAKYEETLGQEAKTFLDTQKAEFAAWHQKAKEIWKEKLDSPAGPTASAPANQGRTGNTRVFAPNNAGLGDAWALRIRAKKVKDEDPNNKCWQVEMGVVTTKIESWYVASEAADKAVKCKTIKGHELKHMTTTVRAMYDVVTELRKTRDDYVKAGGSDCLTEEEATYLANLLTVTNSQFLSQLHVDNFQWDVSDYADEGQKKTAEASREAAQKRLDQDKKTIQDVAKQDPREKKE
ncbi:MAG TPA: hypothetical protein PK280_12445 [Planctomycetota bacterium]|nr:hypothetical protein [Planctomycetota bacterium]